MWSMWLCSIDAPMSACVKVTYSPSFLGWSRVILPSPLTSLGVEPSLTVTWPLPHSRTPRRTVPPKSLSADFSKFTLSPLPFRMLMGSTNWWSAMTCSVPEPWMLLRSWAVKLSEPLSQSSYPTSTLPRNSVILLAAKSLSSVEPCLIAMAPNFFSCWTVSVPLPEMSVSELPVDAITEPLSHSWYCRFSVPSRCVIAWPSKSAWALPPLSSLTPAPTSLSLMSPTDA
jgi:hypothetical protein